MPNLIGQSLGRYHILEQLGEGGMAIVYKAYDTRLETEVAVKFIRLERLTGEMAGKALKRFEREAKALARLTHPNIVKVIDYGEYENQPYLVMEYLPGGTLKQRLGKPMAWREAVRLLLPVTGALDYAHQHGIIHRDVKPSNILITQSGEVMLTDFGVAKLFMGEETEELTDTGAGMGVGTPEYMAPENVTNRQVDQRVDIYALGVVLYELITGRKPYTADTPVAVLFKHVNDPLPRPTSLVEDLPVEVEQLLLKVLAKDPRNRFQSAVELSAAMTNLLALVSYASASAQTKKQPGGKQAAPPVEHEVQKHRLSRAVLVTGSIFILTVTISLALYLGRERFLTPSPLSTPTIQTSTSIPSSTKTPVSTRTSTQTWTPGPLDGGIWIFDRRTNLYFVHFPLMDEQFLRLSIKFSLFLGAGWSPDGNRIVFSASIEDQPNTDYDLYVTDRDGSNVQVLFEIPDSEENFPAWSPDGEMIAFGLNGNVAVIRSDGSGLRWLIPPGPGTVLKCNNRIAWSPDSQRIAFVGGKCEPGDWLFSHVWIINRDGSQLKHILDGDTPLGDIAWSPDGESVVVEVQDGPTYLIDAGCPDLSSGCDVSSRTVLDAFPIHWMNSFYPQWAGEDILR